MLYRVARNTGFLAKELAAPTAESFDLSADTPAAVLPAKFAKNRQPVRQPIPVELARDLAAFLADRTGTVWPGTWATRSADMIARDMAAADIPITAATPDGEQVRDFHATRNTFISNVLRAGANLKEAMQLARHSDPRLTTARYARTQLRDLGTVVNNLPSGSSKGVAPGVAERGDGRQQSRAIGESRPLPAPLSGGGVETNNPLRLQGVEGDRGHPKTNRSGEEGIRTLGAELPARRFSKAVLSTTQPPLRQAEC